MRFDLSRAMPCLGKAGSITVHHVRAVHGSATNFSGSERRFLLFQYRAADAWPLLGLKDGIEKFDELLLAGEPTLGAAPRAGAGAVPLPPAEYQGSIYENQRASGRRYFDTPPTAHRGGVDKASIPGGIRWRTAGLWLAGRRDAGGPKCKYRGSAMTEPSNGAWGPLQGVKVVACSTAQAGTVPYMLMADLGAEVIKIEVPKVGDNSRGSTVLPGMPSTYFETNNRGVKSVTLNLKTAEGREILQQAGRAGRHLRPELPPRRGREERLRL